MRVRLAWKWDLAAASSKNVRRIDLRNQWGWLLLSQRSLHRRWFGLSPPRQVLLLQPADSPSQNTWIHLSQISVRTQEFSQVQKTNPGQKWILNTWPGPEQPPVANLVGAKCICDGGNPKSPFHFFVKSRNCTFQMWSLLQLSWVNISKERWCWQTSAEPQRPWDWHRWKRRRRPSVQVVATRWGRTFCQEPSPTPMWALCEWLWTTDHPRSGSPPRRHSLLLKL